jgi:hypothetical protein
MPMTPPGRGTGQARVRPKGSIAWALRVPLPPRIRLCSDRLSLFPVRAQPNSLATAVRASFWALALAMSTSRTFS